MKKMVVTLFILCLISSSTSFGQFGFSIGPKVGFNLANLSFDPDEGVNKSGRFGLMFGAAAELTFSSMFAVQIEPMYVQKGATEVDVQTDVGPGKADFNLAELQFPILFKLEIPAGIVKPYFLAGPNIGVVLSSDIDVSAGGQTAEIDYKDQTSSTDFCIDFGGGIGYPITPVIVLTFDIRYSLGLSNLEKNPQQIQSGETSTKSNGIQFQFGAMFGI
jgi:hypothetical protein